MELDKLKALAVSDSGFIFDPSLGHSYIANETALFIISKLKTGMATAEISKAIADEYDVDSQIAERDIIGMLEQLSSNYLI